ncbi:hypothetical protein GIS00_07325 [Nakamurella sp. YIM 132087]|uniref:Uncharacterized protein n=1 Tax=Nakamurella alba TaxID=2665158 RepID=A0A7K1FKI2_9ACTN|nr:hypothetical protein [Nakamurella alba]MTD13753.1 hypothetical protein [Nakamurella alba]
MPAETSSSTATLPPQAGRPVRPSRNALVLRAVLVVLAAALSAVGATAWVTAPLGLAALAVTAEWAARLRRRGPLDTVLVATAGAVSALALIGLVLNYLPGGLTRLSWSIAIGIVCLVVLALVARRPLPPASPLRRVVVSVPRATWLWAGLTAVLVLGAVLLSVRSVQTVNVPPTEFSATSVADGRATLLINAGTPQDGLSVVVTTDGRAVTAATGLSAGPDQSTELTVDVAPGARSVVTLVRADGTVDRTLVIDTRTPTTSLTSGSGS